MLDPVIRDLARGKSQKYTSADYSAEVKSERVILQITPDRQRTHL